MGLTKRSFPPLTYSGDNYLTWVEDVEIHLIADKIQDAIKEGNTLPVEEKARALILICHHLDLSVKCEHLHSIYRKGILSSFGKSLKIVEQRKQPELRGLPTAVVQYNSWKGGGLIAVSYEARKYGVKRSMRGDEAKQVCPQIQLVQVPVARGKADLNLYRNAGSEVVSILARKGRCERASIDEVYLDLTDAAQIMLAETPPESLEAICGEALKSHILGLNEDENNVQEHVRQWLCQHDADHRDKLLACGALIVADLRMQVLKETEFTCSAGIAHNKMLAKLASGMNKPAQQTVVPFSSVKALLDLLPVKKMKQLGGKLGNSLQSDLGVNTVGDLLQFSEEKLQECYGINTGTWLWNIARGICGDEVEGRLLPKSHGSGKTFPGPRALRTIASVQHWLNELSEELSERLRSDLEQNKRIAHTLTLHARAYRSNDSDSHKNFPSKSCPLRYGNSKIQEDALNLFQAGLREYLSSYRVNTQGSQHNGWAITALSVTASKIVATPSGTCSITKYFHGQDPSCSLSKQSLDAPIDTAPLSPPGTESQNLGEPQIEFPGEENKIKHAMPQQERKRKDQGKSPILKYFQRYNPSSAVGKHEEPSGCVEDCTAPSSSGQDGEIWRYKMDDIDPSVIDELPQEIQQEVRAWLQTHKRPNNIAKRGSSIAHYFLPTKNT